MIHKFKQGDDFILLDVNSGAVHLIDEATFKILDDFDGTNDAQVIDKLKTKRVSAAELNRTKEFLVGNFRLSHERVTSKLFFYGQTMLSFGRIVEPQEQVDGIQAVTSDDLIPVAREIFDDSRRSISWVLPVEPNRSALA